MRCNVLFSEVPQKIHSIVRMISFRPNFPRSLNVADDYLCSLHISSPDLLETINVINFEVSIYVTLQTTILPPPHPTKVGVLSLHTGSSLLKLVFKLGTIPLHNTSRGAECKHQSYFCPNSSEPLHTSFLAAFQYGCVIYITFDFFPPCLAWYFSTPNVLYYSLTNSQSNLGTHPLKTLWITEFIWKV